MAKRLSKSSLNRIGRTVRKSERTLPPPPRRDRTGLDDTPAFWIELLEEGTGDLAGWYKWKKVYPDPASDGWIDAGVDSGDLFTATSASDVMGLDVGTRVLVIYYGFDASDPAEPVYIFVTPGGPVMRVRLTNTTGGVYNVFLWSDEAKDNAIATSVTPKGGRPFGTSIDFVDYAEEGLGWWDFDDDEDAVFILEIAFGETFAWGPCTITS